MDGVSGVAVLKTAPGRMVMAWWRMQKNRYGGIVFMKM